MPGKAKRKKDRKWKLAHDAVWGCVPARLCSEVLATWVPATELVPGGERAPWSSSSWGKSIWSAGREAWAQVGATGVSTRLFGNIRVFRYRRVGRALYVLAQPARAGDMPATDYAAAGAEQLTRRQQSAIGRIREELQELPAVKELKRHLLAEVRARRTTSHTSPFACIAVAVSISVCLSACPHRNRYLCVCLPLPLPLPLLLPAL